MKLAKSNEQERGVRASRFRKLDIPVIAPLITLVNRASIHYLTAIRSI